MQWSGISFEIGYTYSFSKHKFAILFRMGLVFPQKTEITPNSRPLDLWVTRWVDESMNHTMGHGSRIRWVR